MPQENSASYQPLLPARPPYGGFWRRFWAYMLDGIIASLIPAVICLPLLIWQAMRLSAPSATEEVSASALIWFVLIYLLWSVLGFLSFWLYFAFLESGKHQATWGKRLLGIKVVGERGQRISFARATGRFFAKLLSYMIFYIGFIIMPFTNRKRALHDMIADTYVVHASFKPGDPLPPTPRRIGWLITTVLLLVGGYIVLIALAFGADRQQAKTAARTAAAQLYAIHNDNANWPELPGMEDMDFFQDEEDSLYVSFRNNDDEYLLSIPAGENSVCCVAESESECVYIDFPKCR